MSTSTPPTDSWLQQTLVPTDRAAVTFKVHLDGPSSLIGVTAEVRNGTSNELAGLISTTFSGTSVGQSEAVGFLRLLLETVWDTLAAF